MLFLLCTRLPLTELSKMHFLSPLFASASLRSLCAFDLCSRHSNYQALPHKAKQKENIPAQQDLDSEAVLYLNSAVFGNHFSFMPMPRIREWVYISVPVLIKHIITSVICLPLSPLWVPLKLSFLSVWDGAAGSTLAQFVLRWMNSGCWFDAWRWDFVPLWTLCHL